MDHWRFFEELLLPFLPRQSRSSCAPDSLFTVAQGELSPSCWKLRGPRSPLHVFRLSLLFVGVCTLVSLASLISFR